MAKNFLTKKLVLLFQIFELLQFVTNFIQLLEFMGKNSFMHELKIIIIKMRVNEILNRYSKE
jgi:hypothetical protein